MQRMILENLRRRRSVRNEANAKGAKTQEGASNLTDTTKTSIYDFI